MTFLTDETKMLNEFQVWNEIKERWIGTEEKMTLQQRNVIAREQSWLFVTARLASTWVETAETFNCNKSVQKVSRVSLNIVADNRN